MTGDGELIAGGKTQAEELGERGDLESKGGRVGVGLVAVAMRLTTRTSFAILSGLVDGKGLRERV